ncbi:MFS transporter [Cytobacillus sp. Hm23]
MTTTMKSNLWQLPILAFCSFLVGYDSIATVPLLPEIAKTTDMPLQAGGLLYVSYAVAYAITAPIMGSISDRWNRKGILMIGMVLFGVSTALVGMGETFTTLVLFRILSGIGAGMIEPIVYAIVGDSYPYEERGRAMGIVTAALISSAVVGVPVAGYITELTTWNWTFWSIAILSGIAFIAVSITIPNQERKNEKAPSLHKQFTSVFHDSSVLFSLFGSFLYFGALQGMFVLTGVYYYTFYAQNARDTGLILMIAGLSSVLGSLIGGKLADKLNKKWVVSVACLLSAFFVFFLSLLTTNFWVSVTLHVIWAALFAIGQSAYTALISELNPQARGTVMSLNSSAMYIGAGILTAIAAGLLKTGSFWQIGLMCGIANILVMLITVFVIHENKPVSKGTNP